MWPDRVKRSVRQEESVGVRSKGVLFKKFGFDYCGTFRCYLTVNI